MNPEEEIQEAVRKSEELRQENARWARRSSGASPRNPTDELALALLEHMKETDFRLTWLEAENAWLRRRL